MICDCGCVMLKDKERSGGLAVRFKRCPSCGRCDGFTLTRNGNRLSGETARRAFRAASNNGLRHPDEGLSERPRRA